MNWVNQVAEASEYVKCCTVYRYNQLPVDNKAMVAKSWLNGVSSIGGLTSAAQIMASESLGIGLLRLGASALSISGDFTGSWAALVNESRKAPEAVTEKYNQLLEWAIKYPLATNYIPKILGTGFMIATGICDHKPAYIAAGTTYLITNSMKAFGNRKTLLASTALSGAGGAGIFINGISHLNIGDIASGLAGMSIAVLLSRINPRNLSAESPQR